MTDCRSHSNRRKDYMIDTIQNILILLLFIMVLFKPRVNIEMRKLSKEEFLDIVKNMKDEDE